MDKSQKLKVKSKKFKYFLIFGVILFCTILFLPKKAKALAWYEVLISDGDFTKSNSMTLTQIQYFLNTKGGYLRNYSWGGKSAARWIYDESREHGINPQVILVTLQKESSLITLGSPSQTRLDWAMGYDCYPGGYRIDFKGFGNQIHYSAAWMRARFNEGRGPGTSRVGDRISITYKSWETAVVSVYLSNSATAVLYRYTPYVYNGNYNFYHIGRSWFKWSNYVPVLYRISGGDGKVYLVDRGYRFWIPNISMMEGWGFRFSQVFDVSADLVNSIPESGQLTRFPRDSSFNIYFMDFGIKKLIASDSTFNDLNFDWSLVRYLSDSLLGYFATEGRLTTLIKSKVNGKLYWVISGDGYLVNDMITLESWKFNPDGISTLKDMGYFLKLENGNFVPYGVISYLVKDSNSQIYFVANHEKYPVSSEVFPDWGFSTGAISQLPDSILAKITTGPELKRLAKAYGSKQIWYFKGGYKKWVPDIVTLTALFSPSDVINISPRFVTSAPTGRSVSALVRGSNLKIYLTENGYKRWIVGSEAFVARGFSPDQVKTVSDKLMAYLPNRVPVFYLAKGTSDKVYLVYGGRKKHIASFQVFQSWGFKATDIIKVSNSTIDKYPTNPPLYTLIKAPHRPEIYVMSSGKKRWIPNIATFERYGFSWSNIWTVSAQVVGQIPSGSSL